MLDYLLSAECVEVMKQTSFDPTKGFQFAKILRYFQTYTEQLNRVQSIVDCDSKTQRKLKQDALRARMREVEELMVDLSENNSKRKAIQLTASPTSSKEHELVCEALDGIDLQSLLGGSEGEQYYF